MKFRLGALRYPIGAPADFAAFAARVAACVAEGVARGGELLVLPEYLPFEALAGDDAAIAADAVRSVAALQRHHTAYLALGSELARRHGIYLLAGTFLVATAGGRYRNRAHLFAPDGRHAWQDKLTLTGFERAAGILEPGDELRVFDTAFGRLGIAICYDAEFPLYARAQAEAGAQLLLVPSCTDTPAGATRVRIGCRARALENGLHVACAVTAGRAPWSAWLDSNEGRAAIYTPVDRGFPDDGIAAESDRADDWAVAEIDLGRIEAMRAEAQVANTRDWPAQLRPAVVRARVEAL